MTKKLIEIDTQKIQDFEPSLTQNKCGKRSEYNFVYWVKTIGKWYVQVRNPLGKTRNGGYYHDEKKAGTRADIFLVALWEDSLSLDYLSKLNFPEKLEEYKKIVKEDNPIAKIKSRGVYKKGKAIKKNKSGKGSGKGKGGKKRPRKEIESEENSNKQPRKKRKKTPRSQENIIVESPSNKEALTFEKHEPVHQPQQPKLQYRSQPQLQPRPQSQLQLKPSISKLDPKFKKIEKMYQIKDQRVSDSGELLYLLEYKIAVVGNFEEWFKIHYLRNNLPFYDKFIQQFHMKSKTKPLAPYLPARSPEPAWYFEAQLNRDVQIKRYAHIEKLNESINEEKKEESDIEHKQSEDETISDNERERGRPIREREEQEGKKEDGGKNTKPLKFNGRGKENPKRQKQTKKNLSSSKNDHVNISSKIDKDVILISDSDDEVEEKTNIPFRCCNRVSHKVDTKAVKCSLCKGLWHRKCLILAQGQYKSCMQTNEKIICPVCVTNYFQGPKNPKNYNQISETESKYKGAESKYKGVLFSKNEKSHPEKKLAC